MRRLMSKNGGPEWRKRGMMINGVHCIVHHTAVTQSRRNQRVQNEDETNKIYGGVYNYSDGGVANNHRRTTDRYAVWRLRTPRWRNGERAFFLEFRSVVRIGCYNTACHRCCLVTGRMYQEIEEKKISIYCGEGYWRGCWKIEGSLIRTIR